MKIQSLSVVVPGGCPNKCKFCVSSLHPPISENLIEKNLPFIDLYERDYMKRLSFARDNGCNVAIITGDGEPLINEHFLNQFAWMNSSINNPFNWIELQTSGVTLNKEKLRWLRNKIGVTTISLSLSNIFSSTSNAAINGTPDKLVFSIPSLCALIKEYDFNLRLSLNMTYVYNSPGYDVNSIFNTLRSLSADQVTFRILYDSGTDNECDEWIKMNSTTKDRINEIQQFIKKYGVPLERLPFGAMRYSVFGISTIIDNDCMSMDSDKDVVKYLILRPNCKLYSRWDDYGSILF